MDISKAVRNFRPLSKHLLYEFGFYESSPAICIDVIAMNIDLLNCLPFPDSIHEVCTIRCSHFFIHRSIFPKHPLESSRPCPP